MTITPKKATNSLISLLSSGTPIQLDLLRVIPGDQDRSTWLFMTWPNYKTKTATPVIQLHEDGMIGVISTHWEVPAGVTELPVVAAASYQGALMFVGPVTIRTPLPGELVQLILNFAIFPAEK